MYSTYRNTQVCIWNEIIIPQAGVKWNRENEKLSTKKWNRGEFHPMIVDNPQKNDRRNTVVIKIEKWLEFKKFILHRWHNRDLSDK